MGVRVHFTDHVGVDESLSTSELQIINDIVNESLAEAKEGKPDM